MLYDGAIGPSREKYFNKKTFYSHNKLYPWSILKLHGSLNWWKFIPFSPNTSFSDSKVKEIYQLNKDFIIIQERDPVLGSNAFTLNEQLYIDPVIITPVLYKRLFQSKITRKYLLTYGEKRENRSPNVNH